MYQPITLFIGLRYICGSTVDRFGYFAYWFSTSAITLSVMALVVVLSVMNGFERELQDNILGLTPQVILFSSTGSINPQQLSENTIKLQGVNYIAPLTTGNIVVQSAHNISAGVMIGINPEYRDPLIQYLINVKLTNLESGKYNIILGQKLAWQLQVDSGDQLRLIVPSVSNFTLIGRLPSQRLFNVIGTFLTNSEVDNYQVLVNIEDASRLMHYPKGNITGWRLWVNKPLEVDKLSQQKLPEGTKWQDWRAHKGELFQAIRMEKNMMGLLLSLIIIIAVFNVITSISLMVMDKKSEIAILQTQGLLPQQIMIIFIIQGASTGIIGALLGIILGILLANGLTKITPIINLLFDKASLPVIIDPLQVITIALVMIAIALLSTLYPSWLGATTQPTESLRYE